MSNDYNSIRLKDGRTLAYYEYGAPSGDPVFYFHGSGAGSSMYAKLYDKAARECRIRLIAPDRPGIGNSTLKAGRRLSDWAIDVVELADLLGLQYFSILSESGGSAYAFICASKLSDRIKKAVIVSGLCPMDNQFLQEGLSLKRRMTIGMLARSPEWLIKSLFIGMKKNIQKNPSAFFKKMEKKALPVEKEILSSGFFKEVYRDSLLNSFKQGENPVIQDIRILMGNWGLDLKEIKSEIHFWHGNKDSTTPVEMIKRAVNLLSNGKAEILQEETHMSLLQRHAGDILKTIS